MQDSKLRELKLKKAILISDCNETECQAKKEVLYSKLGKLIIEIHNLELNLIRQNCNLLSDN